MEVIPDRGDIWRVAPTPPPGPSEVDLLKEIRDALITRRQPAKQPTFSRVPKTLESVLQYRAPQVPIRLAALVHSQHPPRPLSLAIHAKHAKRLPPQPIPRRC